ncbi:MAG: hypothetical protein GDA49_11445 [Rhodospirillales bacterium]|nr:hypothetical protein [Rhodospirillales bacterium]
MAEWTELSDELDRWSDAGRTATFWWRDDDAGPDDGKLPVLLDQRRGLGVPLALAVVPHWLEDAACAALDDDGCHALQHGAHHTNRASADRRKTELALEGLEAGLTGVLADGLCVLETRLAKRMLPVMVPPWNRADDVVIRLLADLGFEGLSMLGPRDDAVLHDLTVANVHVDIIDWKQGGRFASHERCLAATLGHLRARRAGTVDSEEPTGLMTHHRVQDVDCWRFVDSFVSLVRDHPAARWLDASQIFFRSGPTS